MVQLVNIRDAQRGSVALAVTARDARVSAPSLATRAELVTRRGELLANMTAGQVIVAEGRSYQYSPGASTIPDLPDLIPYGDIVHADQWGLIGEAIPAGVPWSAVTPSTDERAAMQAALDWASQKGAALHGDITRVYGTSGPVYFGTRTGATVHVPGAKVYDLQICATPGTWGGMEPVFYLGTADFQTASTKATVDAFGLRVSAAGVADGAVRMIGNRRARIYNPEAVLALAYHWYDGDEDIDLNMRHNTDTHVYSLAAVGEYVPFSEPLPSGRTGLWIAGADSKYLTPQISRIHNLVRVAKCAQTRIINAHMWNDTGAEKISDATQVSVDIFEAVNCQLINPRIEGGKIRITGSTEAQFSHRIALGSHSEFAPGPAIEIVTSLPDTRLTGLSVTGMKVDVPTNEALLTTTGSGSFGALRPTWYGNANYDNAVYRIGGVKHSVGGEYPLIDQDGVHTNFDTGFYVGSYEVLSYAPTTDAIGLRDTTGNVTPNTGTRIYRKIGNRVFIDYKFTNIDTTGLNANEALLMDLPFTAGEHAIGSSLFVLSSVPANSIGAVFPRVFVGQDVMRFSYPVTSGGYSNLLVSDIASGADDIFVLSISYEAS